GLDVLGRIGVLQRVAARAGPAPVLGRDLRGRIEPPAGRLAHELPEQPLAAPLAVGVGGVEEVAAEIDGPPQGAPDLVVVAARPSDHPPHAIPDLTDGPAEATEPARLQRHATGGVCSNAAAKSSVASSSAP